MRVIGLAGWSGAGKTTLIEKLIPELRRRGFSVSTLKHAHHAFDMDRPGKDSHRHREAGAAQVLVAAERRLALLTELRDQSEPRLDELLTMFAPVDLVLVEGYRTEAHPKIEIYRTANGKPLRHGEDARIVALISDLAAPPAHLPHAHIDDVAGAADLVLAHAVSRDEVRARLAPVHS
ncbi:MAG: molybdopterin-guanine dinucleotide biosynthesis protein B [Rhodoblastus sp.]